MARLVHVHPTGLGAQHAALRGTGLVLPGPAGLERLALLRRLVCRIEPLLHTQGHASTEGGGGRGQGAVGADAWASVGTDAWASVGADAWASAGADARASVGAGRRRTRAAAKAINTPLQASGPRILVLIGWAVRDSAATHSVLEGPLAHASCPHNPGSPLGSQPSGAHQHMQAPSGPKVIPAHTTQSPRKKQHRR